jgi:hypothetical protein
MYNWLKLFWLSLLFSLLSACSDKMPTIIPMNENQAQVIGKLRLEIPSLGRGELSELKLVMGEMVELRATLENPAGEGMPNQTLSLNSTQGNFFTENNLLTDHHGQATSVLLATVKGGDKVTVIHLGGLAATLFITVSDPKRVSRN